MIAHTHSVEIKIKQVPKRNENVNNSVMVSAGVSWMKKTSVVIVEVGAKVNNE